MNRYYQILSLSLLALAISAVTLHPTIHHESKQTHTPLYSTKTRILGEHPSNQVDTVKAKVEADYKSGALQKIKERALNSEGKLETIWVDDEEPTYELYQIPEYKDDDGYPVYMLVPLD